MTARRLLVALAAVTLAVVLQTTLFVRLRPFDVAPALVVLVVIGVARQVAPERALPVAFLSGLLLDALGSSPLGLWGLVVTTTAYATYRLRDRFEDDWIALGVGVFGLTLGALALFAVVGTIFGQKTLADGGLIRKLVLPAVYNTLLAPIVLTPLGRLMGRERRLGAGWDI